MGSRLMKRVKPACAGIRIGASASSAMAIMWRARASKPETSPGV